MSYVDAWENEPDPVKLEEKEIELFDTVCNPNNPSNFVEAIDNAHEGAMKELGKLLKEGDAQKIGNFLLGFVEDYWCGQAHKMAEDCLLLGDKTVLGRW